MSLIKSLLLSGVLAVALMGCAPSDPIGVSDIHWADGDSGEVDGVRFRLAGVDAPETGSTAACEKERRRGEEARSAVQSWSRDAALTYVLIEPEDRYGRIVIDLFSGDNSLIDRGLKTGHLKPWPHLNGRALEAKPDWCSND